MQTTGMKKSKIKGSLENLMGYFFIPPLLGVFSQECLLSQQAGILFYD